MPTWYMTSRLCFTVTLLLLSQKYLTRSTEMEMKRYWISRFKLVRGSIYQRIILSTNCSLGGRAVVVDVAAQP